jgi:hypothetical protein
MFSSEGQEHLRHCGWESNLKIFQETNPYFTGHSPTPENCDVCFKSANAAGFVRRAIFFSLQFAEKQSGADGRKRYSL